MGTKVRQTFVDFFFTAQLHSHNLLESTNVCGLPLPALLEVLNFWKHSHRKHRNTGTVHLPLTAKLCFEYHIPVHTYLYPDFGILSVCHAPYHTRIVHILIPTPY